MRIVLLKVEFEFYYNEILLRMSSLHQNLLRIQIPLYFRRLDFHKNFLKQFAKMYEPEDDMNYEEEESEEIPTEMWQESSWITISAFFEEKGKDFVFTKKC